AIEFVTGLFARRAEDRRTRDAKRAVLQVLYIEVLYNTITLTKAQDLHPPVLLVTQRVWEKVLADPERLTAAIGESNALVVAAPYLQVDTYQSLFGQDPWSLVGARLKGQ